MAGPPLATAEEEEEHNEHDLRFLSTFSVSQMLGTVFDIRIDFCLGLGEVTVLATRARFTGRLGKL